MRDENQSIKVGLNTNKNSNNNNCQYNLKIHTYSFQKQFKDALTVQKNNKQCVNQKVTELFYH